MEPKEQPPLVHKQQSWNALARDEKQEEEQQEKDALSHQLESLQVQQLDAVQHCFHEYFLLKKISCIHLLFHLRYSRFIQDMEPLLIEALNSSSLLYVLCSTTLQADLASRVTPDTLVAHDTILSHKRPGLVMLGYWAEVYQFIWLESEKVTIMLSPVTFATFATVFVNFCTSKQPNYGTPKSISL